MYIVVAVSPTKQKRERERKKPKGKNLSLRRLCSNTNPGLNTHWCYKVYIQYVLPT